MPNSQNLCVLAAEIVGGDRLAARLGKAETTRAVERCMNRVDLAIGGSDGEVLARDGDMVVAAFRQCSGGVMAACEAIDRVRKLPPASGAQMQLRIGIHYGSVDGTHGEGTEGARRILRACAAGQSLASSAVIAELDIAVRNFASAETFHGDLRSALPWPVFSIGNQIAQNGAVASQPPRPPSTPPLASSHTSKSSFASTHPGRSSLASTPPAGSQHIPDMPLQTSLKQRLRLHHQQKTIFVEENRPVVLIGRETGNDIVIDDPRASRQHARIERRRGGFMLIDQSTNGCFVTLDGQGEHCIKDGEYLVSAAGRIGCGFSAQESEDDLVFFEIA
ncbi:MAG: FHA domain-containing protein [Azoarcus sp.]|jgi:hypothetical protein|nr:FHA domain-containing protein [Azoarcus sp.]